MPFYFLLHISLADVTVPQKIKRDQLKLFSPPMKNFQVLAFINGKKKYTLQRCIAKTSFKLKLKFLPEDCLSIIFFFRSQLYNIPEFPQKGAQIYLFWQALFRTCIPSQRQSIDR